MVNGYGIAVNTQPSRFTNHERGHEARVAYHYEFAELSLLFISARTIPGVTTNEASGSTKSMLFIQSTQQTGAGN